MPYETPSAETGAQPPPANRAGSFAPVLGLVLVALCGAVVLGASESENYRLEPATADTGGAELQSAAYRLGSSTGQEVVVGTSSSPHFVLQSGFWGYAGSGLVPVELVVARNAIDPQHVDLIWSGNNPPYDVFQATDCANVFAQYYDTTGGNAYPDVTSPAASLVCYQVLATAPGPAPPPDSTRSDSARGRSHDASLD